MGECLRHGFQADAARALDQHEIAVREPVAQRLGRRSGIGLEVVAEALAHG